MNNGESKMKILARQLTLDLYNCTSKRLENFSEVKEILSELTKDEPKFISETVAEDHQAIIGASPKGHIALHIYKNLRYVAADIFSCEENSEPEEISKALRKFFQPDKMKSTFLKRGDFGQEKEVKPKIKTKVAPFRRVKNAGAKVVKKIVSGK